MGIEASAGVGAHCQIRSGIILLGVAALLSLAACGGGGGGGGGNRAPSAAPPAAETLFTSQNEWQGVVPADAENISADEFRRKHAAGELQIVTAQGRAEQEQARREHIQGELQYLESRTDLTDDERSLVERARATQDLFATPMVTLPNGDSVVLLDLGTRIEELARAHRDANDPAAMRAAYAMSYSVLDDDLKSQVPAPESLAGASLDDINAARRQLDAVLENVVDLDRTRLDLESPPLAPARQRKAAALVDNDGTCAPTGLARTHWFPLRSFVSPMKQQGSRGTCWAFTAVAAIESRERVQNDVALDVSEQFFVNQAKHQWLPSEFVDGGSASAALNASSERNVLLSFETDWPYNPSNSRPSNASVPGVVGTAASYVGACLNYSPTWTCSESSHQSHRYCTTQNGRPFCGYSFMTHVGTGVRASRARLLWKSGQTFDLNAYRALLASGVSIMASFPVYDGFVNVGAAGRVTDYERNNEDGSHAVQVVGFISNEDMTFGPAKADVGGGGYFVIRNSWGCAQADAGYWYVPADYVRDRFSKLEAMEFDARRSERWLNDQALPGSTAGLSIDPRNYATVDLRVPTNIASTFSVRQPGASHVRLTVTSNRDGQLFDGQWIVENPAAPGGILFNNELWIALQTRGEHRLTLTARYGTQVVTATKLVYATNTPPTVELESIGLPSEGEPFAITAVVTDINEPSLVDICNAMTWEVQAPDAVVSGVGCSRTIRFGAAGARTVRVRTVDRDEAVGATIRTYSVQPPPANPYPRVNSAGLYSRDFDSNPILGCRLNTVPTGAIIDVRRRGCSFLIGTQPPRFEAHLDIENPLNETLSYQWTLTARYPSDTTPRRTLPTTTSTPVYPVEPIIFGGLNAANPCAIEVTVVAPETSRNKRLRVWSGQCIFIEDAPR